MNYMHDLDVFLDDERPARTGRVRPERDDSERRRDDRRQRRARRKEKRRG